MSERISAANVRHPTFTSAEWMASDGRDVPLSFLDAVADQTEADAAELARLRPAEVAIQQIQREIGGPIGTDLGLQPFYRTADEVASSLSAERALRVENVKLLLEHTRLTRRVWADAEELGHLRPLAAEGEALQRVREHPERHKDISLWICDGLSGCFTLDDGKMTAPSLTALADKLDAIAAARVPKPEPPEEWCVVRLDQPRVVQAEWGFKSREDAMAAARRHPAYQRRTAARIVRHPDGSFTVSPERGE